MLSLLCFLLCAVQVWSAGCVVVDGEDLYGPLGTYWWGSSQVGVVCSGQGSYCAVTYDVRSTPLVHKYKFFSQECGEVVGVTVVQPFVDVLKDQSLLSCNVMGAKKPNVCGANFSLNDVDLNICCENDFASPTLDACVLNAYEPLKALGKVHVPSTGKCLERALSLEDVRFLQEPGTYVRWIIVEHDFVRKAMLWGKHYKYKRIFVLMRQGYAFHGTVVCGGMGDLSIPQESLLYHKLSQASGDMERVYAFSEESANACINYKDGRILWN